MLSRSKAQGQGLDRSESHPLGCPSQGLPRPHSSLTAKGLTGVKRRTQSNEEDESVAEPASPGQQPQPEAAAERSPPSSAQKEPEGHLEGMQPSVSQDSLAQEEEEDSDAANLAGDLQKVRI